MRHGTSAPTARAGLSGRASAAGNNCISLRDFATFPSSTGPIVLADTHCKLLSEQELLKKRASRQADGTPLAM
jgi:hypothetical protein